MRVTIVAITVFVATACGTSEEESTAASAAQTEVAASAALPTGQVLSRLGGFIVPVQQYHVELLPKTDGKVEAVVMNAQGEVVAASAGLTLAVKLTGSDNQQHDVEMTWDADRERWVGQVAVEGEVGITTGPAEVAVGVGGEVHTGTAASVVVAAAPTHGGAIVLAGDYSVELVPVEGALQAFVIDAQGVPVTADAMADAELKINVGAEAAPQELALAWDAEAGCYRADVAAGVDIHVQPVNVFFTSGGRQHRGRIVHVRHGLGAGVRVAAGAEGTVDVNAPGDVEVRGPGGRVSVMGGVRTPNVRVATPTAMVTVRGEAPSASAMVSTGGGVRIGAGGVSAGGVRVRTETPMTSAMASAMASGGISIGGGGGVRIGN